MLILRLLVAFMCIEYFVVATKFFLFVTYCTFIISDETYESSVHFFYDPPFKLKTKLKFSLPFVYVEFCSV